MAFNEMVFKLWFSICKCILQSNFVKCSNTDFLCCIIISVFMLLFIPQQFPEPTKHDFHKTKIFVNKSKYLWKKT